VEEYIWISMITDFKIGDKVRLVDEDGEGLIKAIKDSKIWVEIDGFEMPFTASQVVKIEFDDLIADASVKMSPKDREMAKQSRQKLDDLGQTEHSVYELDLHIEELLDRHDRMSNAEILNYQMSKCRAFVREAIDKRYPKVVLIHGVGEGVLKDEIHHWLHGLDHIEFHDAPYRTYGYGATEVLIRR